MLSACRRGGVAVPRLSATRGMPGARAIVITRSLSSLSRLIIPHRLSYCCPARPPHPSSSVPRRFFGARPPRPREPILPGSLVDVHWLADNLHRCKVLDGSWHMPSEKRDVKADFAAAHLPSAQLFDLDEVCDHSTALPHMLPSATDFAEAAGRLGLRSDDAIVVYDTKGLFSAARVWYTFRCFGARDVAVLQGGLPLWLHHRLPVEEGSPAPPPSSATFVPTDRRRVLVRSYADMLNNATAATPFQVLDARSPGRFSGTDPEPRPGLSSGHMPLALNVPYSALVEKTEGGGVRLKDSEALQQVLRDAGVQLHDSNAPIVTTCGTGVTASVIFLALELLGHKALSLYDGSWTEWAQTKGAPIVKDSDAQPSPA